MRVSQPGPFPLLSGEGNKRKKKKKKRAFFSQGKKREKKEKRGGTVVFRTSPRKKKGKKEGACVPASPPIYISLPKEKERKGNSFVSFLILGEEKRGKGKVDLLRSSISFINEEKKGGEKEGGGGGRGEEGRTSR